jgi:hypothetical protein
MHRADQAMYRAKRASTGWSLEGDPSPEAAAPPHQSLGGRRGPTVQAS